VSLPVSQIPVGGAATFTFQLEVSDGSLTDTDTVDITVTRNAAPVVDAGPTVTWLPDPAGPNQAGNYSIQLTGATASDAGVFGGGQTGLEYSWRQMTGPSAAIVQSNTLTPTIVVDSNLLTTAQNFTFQLTADDGIEQVADTVTVQWQPVANDAPVADAGMDKSFRFFDIGDPLRTVLDATGSSDSDGDTLTYQWTQVSGRAWSFSSPTSGSPTITYPNPTAQTPASETFVFEVEVNDGTSSSTDQVEITVFNNEAPTAAIAAISGLQSSGSTVVLDASGSSDPDSDTLSYSWTQVSGTSVTLTDAASAQASFTAPASPTPTDLIFEVEVSDGRFTDTERVTVTVSDNQSPAPVVAPVAARQPSGRSVTLDASGSTDADGDQLSYSWVQLSGPSLTLAGDSTATPSFDAPTVQSLTDLVFEVTVDDGAASAKAQVTVTIEPAGSITIVQRTEGGEGSFSFTSGLAALSGQLTTQNGRGSLAASLVPQGSYEVTAGDARADGFVLTSIACSDGDSTVSLDLRKATIELAPGEAVTCTFTSANARGAAEAEIDRAVAVRSSMLLASIPGSTRRIDRLSGRVPQGSMQVAGLNLTGLLGQSGSPFSATIQEGRGEVSTSLLGLRRGGAGGARWDVFAGASWQSYDIAGRDGQFGITYGGADYRASDSLLLGVMAVRDRFEQNEELPGGAGSLGGIGGGEGTGFLIGPYATYRIGDRLYADGYLAYGRSDNELTGLAGSEEAFETNRFLSQFSLTGDYMFGAGVMLRPTLAYRRLAETQEA
jgi:hypothetical protein